jgi:hypothetical protein
MSPMDGPSGAETLALGARFEEASLGVRGAAGFEEPSAREPRLRDLEAPGSRSDAAADSAFGLASALGFATALGLDSAVSLGAGFCLDLAGFGFGSVLGLGTGAPRLNAASLSSIVPVGS